MTLRRGSYWEGDDKQKVDSLKGFGEQGPTFSLGGVGRKRMHGDSGWEQRAERGFETLN